MLGKTKSLLYKVKHELDAASWWFLFCLFLDPEDGRATIIPRFSYINFEIFAVIIHIVLFWFMTSRGLAGGFRGLEETYYLHLQGRKYYK
jgi:hypothetical protein